MSSSLTKQRIQSIDLLKGLVMVIMALDHVRDYFHYSAFFFDATDPTQTTWPIFFTRFITHFCAPAFSFLAGTSAFMIGKRKSPSELSSFLFKRGLWLVFVEVIIISFAWKFDINFTHITLATIWQLGISMIVLAGLIHLPKTVILGFSLVIIFGHNLLDNIHFESNVLWAMLHERQKFEFAGHTIVFAYSLLPWIAVMSLGYCFGSLYDSSFEAKKRIRILNGLGIGSIALFFILIAFNTYGDPVKWTNYGDTSKTLMSIFNISKYPPSLLYLLMTLGCSFLFLANSEKLKGKVINFFCIFGRVPFFYYIIHLYLIHLLAILAAEFSGYGWQIMVSMPTFVTRVEALKGYGFNLVTVYLIWILVILLLYPLCKKFDAYKQNHKEKWWLSYL
ncbi:DUF1624 domain-containing protein [Flavobacterium sp.]|uniref:DUF1624 domain-containing protein n=1 Tax=Flavobacterium sp. TaxID=239 RepID=UPI00391A91B8